MHPVKRVLLPALLLVASLVHADKVDDLVHGEMKRQHIPGLTLGIVRDGKLVDKRAYGVADLELNVPMKADDIFEIGSITKQFTGMAVLMLMEEGKVGLEDSISKYIPEAKENWKDIKIRHLLYQTSGLPDYVLIPGVGLVDTFDRKKFFEAITQVPLDYQPGLAWAYSNTNYALLGFVIEKAAGMPYSRFMSERIFKPLGMTNTRMYEPTEIVPNRAHGYLENEGRLLVFHGGASIQSDGAILSNVEDMAKWDAALAQGKLLKPESYKLMWSPATLNSGRGRPYGVGWNLTQHGATPYVGHAGNSVGYSAGFARFLDPKLTVIVMGNVYAFSGELFARQIAEILEPKLKAVPPKEAGSDPDPTRTQRVLAILAALAAGKTDDTVLEPDVTAPLKTSRAAAFPGYRPFAKIDHIGFVSEESQGQDRWLTYRVQTPQRWFTVRVLYSPAGKAAQVMAAADPVAPSNGTPK